jgi:hypothetical protein
MSKGYIYIVGKPDPQSGFLNNIRKLGYQAGVLLDNNLNCDIYSAYDRIEKVDFSKIDEELARLTSIDLGLCGLVCTYENYLVAKAKLGTHFKVPTISVDSAKASTDKLLMRQAFLKEDKSITPEFSMISSVEDALLFSNKNGFPVIIKPTNLVKSLLISKCSNEDELTKNVNNLIATIDSTYKKHRIYEREPRIIIEKYIEGKTCSIAAFVDEQGKPHFCEGVAQTINAHDIGVDDNYLFARYLPADFDDKLIEKLFVVSQKGIKALKLTSTPAHVELIFNDKEVNLIEIGARIGGYRPRMYKSSYGIDLTEQEIKLSLGSRPNLSGNLVAHSAVFELFPEREGMFSQIKGLETITDLCSYISIKAKPNQTIGLSSDGYKAAAIIMVVEQDRERFINTCELVSMLKVETQG